MMTRMSCGSFVINGHQGTANDFLLAAFVACWVIGPPTSVRMGERVFVSYLRAREREAEHNLRSLMREATKTMALIQTFGQGAAGWTVLDLEATMSRIEAQISYSSERYHGAIVLLAKDMPADEIEIWGNDRPTDGTAVLLGVLSGWTE